MFLMPVIGNTEATDGLWNFLRKEILKESQKKKNLKI